MKGRLFMIFTRYGSSDDLDERYEPKASRALSMVIYACYTSSNCASKEALFHLLIAQ